MIAPAITADDVANWDDEPRVLYRALSRETHDALIDIVIDLAHEIQLEKERGRCHDCEIATGEYRKWYHDYQHILKRNAELTQQLEEMADPPTQKHAKGKR